MNKIVKLPVSDYRRLERTAKARGQTPAAWIKSQLAASAKTAKVRTSEEIERPRTLYDRMAPLIGKFKSHDGGNWAEEASERFAEGMVEKHKAGHL